MTVWNKGDLALCVAEFAKDGTWPAGFCGRIAGPGLGRIYTVEQVLAQMKISDGRADFLGFPEFRPVTFNANYFRKIAGNPELLSKRERDWVLRDETEKEDA